MHICYAFLAYLNPDSLKFKNELVLRLEVVQVVFHKAPTVRVENVGGPLAVPRLADDSVVGGKGILHHHILDMGSATPDFNVSFCIPAMHPAHG